MISAIALAIGAFGCDCSPPPPPPPPPPPVVQYHAAPEPPATMTIDDSYGGTFHIEAPTILSVILDTPSATAPAQRCADMGATLDTLTDGRPVCRGVDY